MLQKVEKLGEKKYLEGGELFGELPFVVVKLEQNHEDEEERPWLGKEQHSEIEPALR